MPRAGSHLGVIMHEHAPVLSVSRSTIDHDTLAKMMRTEFSLVICECDLTPDSWKDLLMAVVMLAKPPLFIVTSDFADDHLWASSLALTAATPVRASSAHRTRL